MGDHWDGGPMRWATNGMGDSWVLIGGPMRWGTNEMGDQWDGGPLGLADDGVTMEKGDQWDGGPMSSNNVLGDQWVGGPMRRGPMRWGTNEMGDQWADPVCPTGTQGDVTIIANALEILQSCTCSFRMAQCKTTVLLLTHWRYCSLALSHRYVCHQYHD